jgi:hypothetical protein
MPVIERLFFSSAGDWRKFLQNIEGLECSKDRGGKTSFGNPLFVFLKVWQFKMREGN